jgi:effector-binding domain-containing protein
MMLLGLALLVAAAPAQEEVPEAEADVVVKLLPEWTVVSLSRTGNYSGTGQVLGELFKWVSVNKVPLVGAPFGVFYDDPAEVDPDSTRYEVSIPVPDKTEPDSTSGIRIQKWGGFRVASTMHLGPYADICPAYVRLEKWIPENGWFIAGAPIEFYHNSPMEVPPESLRTDVAFPVKQAPPDGIEE